MTTTTTTTMDDDDDDDDDDYDDDDDDDDDDDGDDDDGDDDDDDNDDDGGRRRPTTTTMATTTTTTTTMDDDDDDDDDDGRPKAIHLPPVDRVARDANPSTSSTNSLAIILKGREGDWVFAIRTTEASVCGSDTSANCWNRKESGPDHLQRMSKESRKQQHQVHLVWHVGAPEMQRDQHQRHSQASKGREVYLRVPNLHSCEEDRGIRTQR